MRSKWLDPAIRCLQFQQIWQDGRSDDDQVLSPTQEPKMDPADVMVRDGFNEAEESYSGIQDVPIKFFIYNSLHFTFCEPVRETVNMFRKLL